MPDIEHAVNLATLEAIYQQQYQEAVIRSAPLFLELELPELDPPNPCYDGVWLSQGLRKRVHDAARQGTITAADVSSIESAQMILSSRIRENGRTDLVVIATLNATSLHVTTARACATLLAKVNGAPTLPAIITIDPSQQALSANDGTEDLLRKPGIFEKLSPLERRQAAAQARIFHLDPGLRFYDIAKTILRLSQPE